MITEQMLSDLKKRVQTRLSPKRYGHTLGVERLAALLAAALLPDMIYEIRAAAVLHDIAKEIPLEEQMQMLSEENFSVTEADLRSPGIIHSFAGPIVIKRDFPDFATDNIISAVLKHTLGARDMSLFDKIIFISDYAEDTRIYDSCIAVRAMLLENFSELSYDEKLERLNLACFESVKGMIDAIKRAGRPLNPRIFMSYEAFGFRK